MVKGLRGRHLIAVAALVAGMVVALLSAAGITIPATIP